ncbi:MMPL family transporter [Uliginosibacterium sediminicola]|uniref:MMPL family transporter n=1 Tax=Uliginosibacterium sediminicola TaxID=2024550 RepID=A0ABU9YT07_9RHOO
MPGTALAFLRRKPALLIWLASVLACLLVVLHTQFVADMSAFLPRNPDAEQRMLVEQLRDGTVARLMIIGIEGADAPARHRSSRALAASLRASQAFITVQNGEAAMLERDRAFYFNNRYLLSPAVTPERFSSEGLRSAISDSLDNLSGTTGMLLKSLLARDPTGETLNLIDDLQQQGGPRLAEGVWVSRDDSRALLLVQTRAAGSDTDGLAEAMQIIETRFKSSRSDPALRMVITGAGVFSVHSRDEIKAECTRLAGLSTLFVIILLLSVYRSLRLLALGMLPVASGALVGVTAVSLGFGNVHGLTLGFGTTLIGEAVDYAIYYFVQARHGSSEAAGQRRFWRTVSIGVLTSICGFAALLVSGFPGLAQLGLYSIGGLLAAVLVTRYVLPALLPAKLAMRDIRPLGARMARVAQQLVRLRGLLLALIIAAAALLLLRHGEIWNHSISALNPVPLAAQELDGQLRAELGAPDARFLLALNVADQQAALVAAEQLDPQLQKLVEQGLLAGYETPLRMLPSLATQSRRQAALPDAASLRSRLDSALQGLPLRADKLQGFIDDVAATRARAPLQRSDLDGTASALAFDAMVVQRSSGYSLLLPLRAPAAGIDAAAVRQALGTAQMPGLLLIDLRDQAETLYQRYLNEAITLSAWGLLAVILVIALSLRSLPRLLRVMLPLAGSVVLVMAGLLLSGHSLSILHLIGLLLTVAIGSNYALFFDQSGAQDAPEMQQRTLVSLVLANLSTVVGFGLLGSSSVSVLAALGVTVGPGALLSLLLAAAFAQQPDKTS